MTFEDLLKDLTDPSSQPVVGELVQLANMGLEQAAAFRQAWPELELRRRRWLLDQLVDLAEDNVELNFDAAYFVALKDRDADVRREAIRGLWEHEGRQLIDTLIDLLENDPDAGVRAEAALALGRFVLQAELQRLQTNVAERIEEALHRVVDNEEEASEVRGRALEAIGARSEDWVQDLIQRSYDEGDRRMQLSAVHAMGRSCDEAWLPVVREEMESDDAEMRFEAVSAVGAIADETSATSVLLLLEDEDAEVQGAAISALGQIGGEQARRALQELIQEGDERIREAAEAALAELEFADDPLGFTVGERNGERA